MNSSEPRNGATPYAPLFMLRVAGLPASVVHPLRCPDSTSWAEEMLREEAALCARGTELADALHDLIAGNDDEESRRGLLRLRRQVHRGTLPAAPADASALVSALDDKAAVLFEEWITALRLVAELDTSGPDRIARELVASRYELRRLADEERLLLALPLASPTLAGQLRTLAPDALVKADKRARRLEQSLLAYLYRTACKTSPFSTFTGVGLGRATSVRPTDDLTDGARVTVPEDWSSHARINVVVLGRLAEAILADPPRRGDLPVELAPGWRRDDDRIRYVRRSVTTGDDSASVSFDTVQDQMFFLRRSGILDRLFDVFAERPALRCGDVVRWLATQQGARPEECERYLSTLLDLGMLQVRCLHIDVHTPEPLRAMRDALRGLDRPWATELAAGLAAPIGHLDRYPTADAATRRALLTALRADLQGLVRGLGSEDATMPQTLLYEDVRVADRALGLDLAAWMRLVGPALTAVERILPVFDRTLAHRITFKGFFLARFGTGGECADVLQLVADFHEDFYDQYASFTADRRPFDDDGEYVPEENWMRLPEITALDEARRHFVAGMRALWARSQPDGEVYLDDELAADVARRLAPIAGATIAQSHFLQLAVRNPDPLVVLNQSYGGLSFAFSRFTHCFDDGAGFGAPTGLSDELRHTGRAIQPSGAVFAEVTGGAATTNLNLHGRLTDYEIVCPGEHSCAPPERQIALDDLILVHDPVQDRLVLRSRRLGREVVPLYFGYLIPSVLPEVPRTLLLLSPSSMGHLDLWGGVPAAEPCEGVTSRPRVRIGSLVLSRRSWRVTAADLPIRAPGSPDHTWFLGWQRWRGVHGLPRQVFVSVQAGDGGPLPAKPQYLDFDSYLSLSTFERLVKSGADRVVLREMLPQHDDLHVRSGRGDHVAELAIQTHWRQ
ncbi:lantibiotic dehydratase [Cryptosporangium minutisporangium]|uniref:Lantibiotic dehydratase N-terminal domain-containing protein n=1 Tax=Cryptosporangium minutisporangium TaxID=113569 RepID=A0ABP6SRW8_9ACTN